MISSDDAFSLLKKWKSEKSSMRFVFAFGCGGGSFPGTIADVVGEVVRLVGDDSRFEFSLSLSDARFEYSGPREAPEELKDVRDKYVGCLAVDVPPGLRISFFELRI